MSDRPHKGPLRLALERSLRAHGKRPQDEAAILLARAYADAIDQSPDRQRALADLGPKYQQILTAQGLTSAAGAVTEEVKTGGRLSAFRSRAGLD